ncbi:MAG TPA: GAF domain-containing protein [Kofleriaceae bacterium]
MTIQAWLEKFLADHDGVAGTAHRCTADDELELIAAVNIPPPVQELVRRVPRGKGMAGLALERGEPVTTCNIQTDTTGQVRPGARMVGAQAGVALPVLGADGKVRAVVGIAYKEERTLKESELHALEADANNLPT